MKNIYLERCVKEIMDCIIFYNKNSGNGDEYDISLDEAGFQITALTWYKNILEDSVELMDHYRTIF